MAGKASWNCRESCSSHELGEVGALRKVGQVLQRQDQSQYRGHQKNGVLALPHHPSTFLFFPEHLLEGTRASRHPGFQGCWEPLWSQHVRASVPVPEAPPPVPVFSLSCTVVASWQSQYVLCARCQVHSSGAQCNSLLLPTSAAPPYVFASPLCFQASSLGPRAHKFPITLQGPAAIS